MFLSVTSNGFSGIFPRCLPPFIKILLVFFFGLVEYSRFQDFDFFVSVHVGCQKLFCKSPLLIVVEVDPMFVLQRFFVFFLEKIDLVLGSSSNQSFRVNGQKSLVGNNSAIVNNQHSFAMFCLPLANLLIGRICHNTLGVSSACPNDTRRSHKSKFYTPEASHSKGRNFKRRLFLRFLVLYVGVFEFIGWHPINVQNGQGAGIAGSCKRMICIDHNSIFGHLHHQNVDTTLQIQSGTFNNLIHGLDLFEV
mmetsp:Transcript_23902/g.38972  ORF Transcript_23902/g.38972 Transcript_23902/m.38972 type:complete len:250 (-) Transcript_23902:547-1296(-)